MANISEPSHEELPFNNEPSVEQNEARPADFRFARVDPSIIKNKKENSTIIRKTTAGLTANIIQLLASLITTFVILTPNLVPAQLGQFYLLYTIIILTSLMISCGMESANSVFVGRGEVSPGRIHSASIIFVCILSGLAITAGSILYHIPALKLIGKVEFSDFMLAMCTVPCILYQSLLWSIMIGTGHLVMMSRTKIFIAAIRLIGDMTAIFGGFGVRGLIVSFLICSSIGALTLVGLIWKIAKPERIGNPELLKKLLGFGIRSHLGTIANQLHFRTDTFILNAFHGTAAVGIYSVAVQVAELPLLFFGAVQNAMFAKLSGSSREMATKTMSYLVRIGIIAWLVITGLGIAIIPYCFELFLDPQYHDSGKAFAFLIGGTTAMGISRMLNPYFLGQLRRPGLLSWIAWINVAVNMGACFVFIPNLSSTGAALASLVSYLANLGLMLICYRVLSHEEWHHFLIPSPRDLKTTKHLIRRS